VVKTTRLIGAQLLLASAVLLWMSVYLHSWLYIAMMPVSLFGLIAGGWMLLKGLV
jgi:hypothetical protein